MLITHIIGIVLVYFLLSSLNSSYERKYQSSIEHLKYDLDYVPKIILNVCIVPYIKNRFIGIVLIHTNMNETRASKIISDTIQSAREETSSKIEKLRLQQKEAIKLLKYDEAQEIQNQIDALNINTTNNALDVIIAQYKESLNDAIQTYNKREQLLTENDKLAENKLKQRFARQFKIAQYKQLRQIKQAEDQLTANRELELIRSVPEQTALIQASQNAALGGDFARAQKLLEKSKEVGKEEADKRVQQLEDNFIKLREEMMNLFGVEMTDLTKKMNYEKERLQDKIRERKKVSATNISNQLGVLCQKFMKIATNYCTGADGEQSSYEIQQIYLDTCKQYNSKPTETQIEQNLTARKKTPLNTTRPQKTATKSRIAVSRNSKRAPQ